MNRKHVQAMVAAALLSSGGLAGQSPAVRTAGGEQSQAGMSAGRELALPQVPAELRTPGERAVYIAKHFWEAMDWRDTTLTRDRAFMEQSASNFYSLFGLTDSITASQAVAEMLAGASVSPETYKTVAEIAELYLYEPYSPVADDEAYAVVVDRFLADGKLDEAAMMRLEDAHQTLMKNRVGHKATDFEFVGRDGRRRRLSDETGRNDFTLLMFYDPDCHDCAALEKHLAESPLPAQKGVGIVMISPYGEQDGLWRSHAATMPEGWTVGLTDEGFEDEGLYDLKITPTVYILDRESRVVRKNVVPDSIDDILGKL